MDAGLLDEEGHRRTSQEFLVRVVQNHRLNRVFATVNILDLQTRSPRLKVGKHPIQIQTETMSGLQIGRYPDGDLDLSGCPPKGFLRRRLNHDKRLVARGAGRLCLKC